MNIKSSNGQLNEWLNKLCKLINPSFLVRFSCFQVFQQPSPSLFCRGARGWATAQNGTQTTPRTQGSRLVSRNPCLG